MQGRGGKRNLNFLKGREDSSRGRSKQPNSIPTERKNFKLSKGERHRAKMGKGEAPHQCSGGSLSRSEKGEGVWALKRDPR